MLCPDVIGRDAEVARLRARLAEVGDGRGGVVAIVGEAGTGKSRLVREAVAATDVLVLSGRAVPGASPLPYRPIAEALLVAFRGRPLPSDPTLAGFERHLGRLVPGWGDGAAADDSPLLVAEGVVRLLAVLARDQPCVLVLEDLHWADAETLAVVDYLSEAMRHERVLCLGAARPVEPASTLLAAIERRDPADVVRLDLLDATDVDRMVAACLAGAAPPAGLAAFVEAHSDGNPFLVEELLTGLVSAGALHDGPDGWEIIGPLTPAVPASLRDSIQRRLGALDPASRRVIGAAALLGRHFEWDLLPGIAEVDGREAVDALRAAVDEQLIDVDGDGFTFRHALTREAVLADLLPPERQALAARAWPAVERANADLPGPTLQLAADLAEAAGEPVAAASRLVESSRRALAGGALASAEAIARRARALAATDAATALDADELLVHVLAAAGKPTDALSLGHALADRLAAAGEPTERRADLFVALARAGLAAGDLDAATGAATAARTVAAADDVSCPPALQARIDTVAAEAALDRAELDDAEALARRAVDAARHTAQPAVQSEALLVLGRILRPQGESLALEAFEAAAEVASTAELPRWHLRAQQELAIQTWHIGGTALLEETRELAARYGAHITVAVMDLSLADTSLSAFDRAGALRFATACVDASRRFGLATESVAQLWLAGAHALAADDGAMQEAIDAALARDPDDQRILADLYGRVLLTRAFVRDELDSLPPMLDTMMEHVRRAPPTQSVYPGRIEWALVHTLADDDLGAAARAELRDAVRQGLPMFTLYAEMVEAVALGRAGDAEAATARFTAAYDETRTIPLSHGMMRSTVVIAAGGAIRDGWGDPVAWLREADAWFAERGYDRLARRCRLLLAEAGAPVPRRGRGETAVPASLRALGVTSREMDVLKLVIDGRSNKAIAEELYLSPKTVERHLTSLFDRTGVRNRQALAQLAVELGAELGVGDDA